ncbi:MAG TPA: SBBP repeat-containing protein, partial [Bryobacteraceae bacterium]|nr:SBBP repeat-containing protein [Bryobacteraceae bacterium]
MAAPILAAQQLQFAVTFGGTCVSNTCTSPYGWSPDYATAITVDSLGNTYVAGTSFGEFPLVNAIEPPPYQLADAFGGWTIPFVAKIDPAGTKLLYATPIGVPQGFCGGLAVDSAGNAYVTGRSQTRGFPGISGTSTGGAFLIKLDPNGKLILSILFGGASGNDAGTSIALDQSGGVYVTGITESPDFPITNGAYRPALSSRQDVFLTKLDGTTGKILYSTFVGPGDSPQVALGPQGDVFIAANTTSTTWLTTTGVVQPLCAGTACADVIALRLRFSFFFGTLSSQVVYATYLGGSDIDTLGGIASDGSGSLFLSGTTNSSDFPVTGSGVAQAACASANPVACGSKAFVARLNPSGTALEYSTYLGGNAIDVGRGIAIDTGGNAYVTGQTT